jgi:hypothetical protein
MTEKFFIPKPALVPELRPADSTEHHCMVYNTADNKLLKWSAPFPLPEIGTRIYITMNGIGWAIVKGYFSSDEYLGVMTFATRPPKWLREQYKNSKAEAHSPQWVRDGIGCEFGTEIRLKRPKETE